MLALKIYREYPLTTITQMAKNAIGILGRAHWPLAAHFWGYSFKDRVDKAMPLIESNVVWLLEATFNFIYLGIYILFGVFLVQLFRSKQFFLLSTLLLFVSYFLAPTFLASGVGSRMRLPVEGLIVLAALYQLKCLYCTPSKHEAMERSTLWLTPKEVSHETTPMGRHHQSLDRA